MSIVAALKYRSIRWRDRLPDSSRSRDIAIEMARALEQRASAFASSLGGIPAALEGRLPADPHERLRVALFASVIVHAVVVLGIGFIHPVNLRLDNSAPTLEVVLVNSRTQERPVRAEALAQANLNGGGDTDAQSIAKSPLPAVKHARSVPELAPETQRAEQLDKHAEELNKRVEQLEREQHTMAQSRVQTPAAAPLETKRESQEEKVATPSAAEIRAKSREAVQLEASIARQIEAYQKRPRRHFFRPSVSEFRYARYVEDWRVKIERIGTLNYPEEARGRGLFGNLLLSVSIKSDGSLEKIEIKRSSGEKLFDAAAIRIVELAAPFAPFPPNIRNDTDILDITRTWMFTRSDQFVTQ